MSVVVVRAVRMVGVVHVCWIVSNNDNEECCFVCERVRVVSTTKLKERMQVERIMPETLKEQRIEDDL